MTGVLISLGITVLIVLSFFLYSIIKEYYKWNKGVCKKTGNPWKMFAEYNSFKFYYSKYSGKIESEVLIIQFLNYFKKGERQ